MQGRRLTREEVVTSLYQRMFDREPESSGLLYWSTGEGSTVAIDKLAFTFLEAAQGTDVDTLAKKTAAAIIYTTNSGSTYNLEQAVLAITDYDVSTVIYEPPVEYFLDNGVVLSSASDENTSSTLNALTQMNNASSSASHAPFVQASQEANTAELTAISDSDISLIGIAESGSSLFLQE